MMLSGIAKHWQNFVSTNILKGVQRCLFVKSYWRKNKTHGLNIWKKKIEYTHPPIGNTSQGALFVATF